MSSPNEDFSMSTLSLNSNGSQGEDWDRSETDIQPNLSHVTPRNSVVFPAEGIEDTPGKAVCSKGKRSLSELLRLHAEKGTDVSFSAEEASRVADVLNQWINSGSSPYEGEDDFFTRSQDDSYLSAKRSPPVTDISSRPRGQSESVVSSRPSSSAGATKS
ncbi:hypothetical protein SERLA73DRAFT_190950 [Serpula lacrymans var. lacrymans S7.3]|uniref:Uncharacterized protein n=2 Tax=Serpula lacrymans var. lacrymans TaxID=341189 RepID=F8QGP0_SERL3|nr:uncharacterized protein SERLADRAFT_456944 [Serpula lacrymans var. lacrymans S7.9]EGN92586.1 hypothetical protein SERLA73DRAFT_190950 [Serpula lacrymans var. lacrymans S7.3]EGO29332.1 hypothetical protein SERLADRAFT_456944 [Serpula lacrymans var. lacrymans S7.9]